MHGATFPKDMSKYTNRYKQREVSLGGQRRGKLKYQYIVGKQQLQIKVVFQ